MYNLLIVEFYILIKSGDESKDHRANYVYYIYKLTLLSPRGRPGLFQKPGLADFTNEELGS